ncbi:uncharacterized protein LOC123868643 isoform X2 [Maniola jurtina]|uniref:uncharacterized protein LOC123868643 isoform X2 n=1 Tax=Maniola jurtina TaxID=191418 RepID=UPI001E68ADC6|nr:uncharacterized protein LOC123868643 isoform X2 [Maniola jurtina]
MMKLKISTITWIQVSGKSISIQIDSDDLLKVLKGLPGLEVGNYRKILTARRENFSKQAYNNPYHPEDDNMSEKEIPLFNSNKYLKKSSKLGITGQENSRLEAKIDNENKAFFKDRNARNILLSNESRNDSKEDELTDHNIIEKNKNQDEKFNLTENISKIFKDQELKPLKRRYELINTRQ